MSKQANPLPPRPPHVPRPPRRFPAGSAQLVALLLEHETVDGSAVYRIVGQPVPEHRPEQLAVAPHPRAAAVAAARDGSGPVLRADR